MARLAEKRAAAEATAAAEKTTTAAEKTSDVAEKTTAAGEKTSEVADADAATDISIISDGKDTGRLVLILSRMLSLSLSYLSHAIALYLVPRMLSLSISELMLIILMT